MSSVLGGLAALVAVVGLIPQSAQAQTAVPSSVAGVPPAFAPVATEPTVEQTEKPGTAALARLYQPVLVVARSDRFWPIPVQTVLTLRDGMRTTCLVVVKTCLSSAPLLAGLHRDDDDKRFLRYPSPLTSVRRNFESIGHALGISDDQLGDWIATPGANPQTTAQVYFYRSPNVPVLKPPLPRHLFVLEYWFFFPFNYLPLALRDLSKLGLDPERATQTNTDYHQGDFEHVDVLVDRRTRMPRYVFMARHDNEGVAYEWFDPALERRGTHPVIYAGFGGHASYARCGDQRRSVKVKLPLGSFTAHPVDHVVCPRADPARPKAPVGPVFEFGPATPLVSMVRDSWACWPGRFGDKPLKGNSILNNLQQIANGPRAPLRQAENDGRTC